MHTEHDVFISYARPNVSFAVELAQALKKQGYAVWIDREISPGSDWVQAIEDAMAESRTILLLLSPSYLHSKWNNFEAGLALKQSVQDQTLVVPVLVEDINYDQLPSPLRQVNALDGRRMDANLIARQIEELLERTNSVETP